MPRFAAMAPRGLRAALKSTAPGKLVGVGKRRGFVLLEQGKPTRNKLRGLTKLLQRRIWSDGELPSIAKRAEPRPGGHWRGPKGGRARGAKVDAQLSRLINSGPSALKKAGHIYNLTKMALAAFAHRGLEPIVAQRVVCSEIHRIGTAADVICYSKKENCIVVVELKCGFDAGRKAAARKGGAACKMQGPLVKAADSNVHRHLAQLAATVGMLKKERATLDRIAGLGVERDPRGLLMYVADEGVEFFRLTEWWSRRGTKILGRIS